MRDPIRLTPADARRVPWRNGRGVTEEIAIWPDGATFEAGDFDGRISKAGVAEPGPFSSFPGFDRALVVTSGAGLVLSHGDAAPSKRLAPLEPYAFSGDWPTTAELVNGPVEDFNVIVRRGRCRADAFVEVLEPRSSSWMGPKSVVGDLFMHVLTGAVRANVGVGRGPDLGTLVAGESLWWREAAGGKSGGISIWALRPGEIRGAVAPETPPSVVLKVWITHD